MNEVIKKIGELHDFLVEAIKSLQEKAIQLDQNIKASNKVKSDQTMKEAELAEREAKIKPIEDVVMLNVETKEKQKEVAVQLEELNTQRNAFSAAQERINNEHAQRKKELDDRAESLKKGEEELAWGRDELEKDKKIYKEEVIEELKSKV